MGSRCLVITYRVRKWISKNICACIYGHSHEVRCIGQGSTESMRDRLSLDCKRVVSKLKPDWVILVQLVYLIQKHSQLNRDEVRVDARVFQSQRERGLVSLLDAISSFACDSNLIFGANWSTQVDI